MEKKNIYGHKVYSIIFAMIVCAFWGSLYPCVNPGYALFGVDSAHVPSVMLFAGMRFLVCGIIMTAMVSVKEKKFSPPDKTTFLPILAVGLIIIFFQYLFQYVGIPLIAENASSKSSIIKQVGFLFISCFAFIFVKEDKFSVRKVIGGILGFCGIVVINLDGLKLSMGVGEILIILASLCSVSGNILTKHVYAKIDSSYVVAYSQLMGGIIFTATGLILGGRMTKISFEALLLLAYMCTSSICAYLLWGRLIRYNDISKMAILKYFEPVFGVLISGVVLGVDNIWKIEYLLAFAIIFAAILVTNVDFKNRKGEQK